MRTQGLVARQKRRRRGLTRPDKSAPVTADLIRRDFTAQRPNEKWCGDFKQIPTLEGPVYLGTVEDLFSRRILGFALSDTYPTAELAQTAVNMALAIRGGNVRGVIFHTDRGSQGGFHWWSQNFVIKEVCDGCWKAPAGDSCDAWPDVVAWSAVDNAA